MSQFIKHKFKINNYLKEMQIEGISEMLSQILDLKLDNIS